MLMWFCGSFEDKILKRDQSNECYDDDNINYYLFFLAYLAMAFCSVSPHFSSSSRKTERPETNKKYRTTEIKFST